MTRDKTGMEQKPLIAITMGDPAGIGPEIIAKVIDNGELFSLCRPVIIGDAGVMKKLIHEMRLPLTIVNVPTLDGRGPCQGQARGP